MTPALHLLAESDRDAFFYERLCERLSDLSFATFEIRPRLGSNWASVLVQARLLLERFRPISPPQQIVVLIAVDNDRAAGHPGGRIYPRPLPGADRRKEPRYQKLEQMVNENLGPDPGSRNVQAILAVPVEMVESWILLSLNPSLQDDDLPLFSEADSAMAREYFGRDVPPQLKDLRKAEEAARKLGQTDLFWLAADKADLDQLKTRSPSFALFRKQVESADACLRRTDEMSNESLT